MTNVIAFPAKIPETDYVILEDYMLDDIDMLMDVSDQIQRLLAFARQKQETTESTLLSLDICRLLVIGNELVSGIYLPMTAVVSCAVRRHKDNEKRLSLLVTCFDMDLMKKFGDLTLPCFKLEISFSECEAEPDRWLEFDRERTKFTHSTDSKVRTKTLFKIIERINDLINVNGGKFIDSSICVGLLPYAKRSICIALEGDLNKYHNDSIDEAVTN